MPLLEITVYITLGIAIVGFPLSACLKTDKWFNLVCDTLKFMSVLIIGIMLGLCACSTTPYPEYYSKCLQYSPDYAKMNTCLDFYERIDK